MAIFHASLKSFSRSRGESATAAVAYRGGLRVADDRTGLVHDYRARLGVEAIFTCAPKSAPAWATTPETLWNAVEKYERRVNSVLARELVVALPAELSPEQRQGLARGLTEMLVERYGVAATAAVHAPSRSGDDRNFHAHILMTTRALGAEGFGEKIRVLNDPRTGPREVKGLRALVAEHTNAALASAGQAQRVDHRTLRAQAADAARRGDLDAVVRLAREPTQHEGKAATAAKRRGEHSPRANANIESRRDNDILLTAGRSRVRAFRASHALPAVQTRSRSPGREPFLGGIEVNARATGPGARLQNDEATRRQRALRIERNNLRAYIEGLRRTVELAEASFNAYVRALRLSAAEFERLAAFVQASGERARAFREAAECYSLYELAVQTHAHRQADAARAQVEADGARRTVEHTEKAKPPVFKPMSRRAWAEKRRVERRALAEAEVRELAAARGASSDDVDAARDRWHAAEARRRSVVPLQGDGRRAAADGMPAAATSLPAVPEAGPPGGAPVEPRPPQQRPPAPRMRPSRRPRF
ncbi:MAG: hypothetical protein BGP24_11155 [Lysobacterales bacterium 69-70]|nr:MobA/MobL family protein [Xanthomonadaceae bacterium]ODU30786.1 MAG: hypothetical protein ABS97_20925 [Xanthomonadaceae bacterium SCN 69-320]ODV22113.1 MAG: hypothetical protein ABT27_02300 [Xanthomonadaceae bacterium SCN 69-25]OJY98374.1 MAG: hypothetical protein BGP24_11155 [Xanthomonadales bacterium 69-70]